MAITMDAVEFAPLTGRNGGSAIQFEGREPNLSDLLDQSGVLGWTRPEQHGDPTQVDSRESRICDHRVKAGDVLHWRVAVDAFDIRVRTSFKVDAPPLPDRRGAALSSEMPELVDATVDSAGPAGGAMEGDYEALVNGVFRLTLDNTYSMLRAKRVRWSITEQRYFVLNSRCVLTVYSAKGGRLIDQLPLFDANSQPLNSADYPGESFELKLEDGRKTHLFHAASKELRASWLSSLSLCSQLETVRHHTCATLIQRATRRVLAVQRFKRLRRYALDKDSLRKSVQEELMGKSAGSPPAGSPKATSSTSDSVTEVLYQHEHWGFRGFRGEFLSRVPAAIRVPAWGTEDEVEVAPLSASQAEAHSAADDRLPSGWKWVDRAWTLDYSGSQDKEGWQFAHNLPVVLGWKSKGFIGNLVRRRKWIRVRNKIKVRSTGQNVNLMALNDIFVITRKCTLIGKFKTGSGVAMNIWRPVVPASYRIVGDCISTSEEPPNYFVSIDMAKVEYAPKGFMKHWVQEVTQFKMVWCNGSVWAWRPVPPSVPPQLLKRKRLQPLGLIFTTTAVPPDVENVAVVSEAYLDPVKGAVLAKPQEVRHPTTNFDESPLADETIELNERHSEFVQATVGLSEAGEPSARTSPAIGAPWKFVIDSTNNLLFLSHVNAEGDATQHFYQDHKGLPSLFRLKKQVAPAEEMDEVARSSRYAPHLDSLMQAEPPQAHSEPITCAAVLSSRYYAGSRIEMVTASGNSLRVWDISKGECTREMSFQAEPITCIAAAGQRVFSGAGKVLVGTDMLAGCQIQGAQFRHMSYVTCTDACNLVLAGGGKAVAVTSGTDVIGRRVRLWVSSQIKGLSDSLNFTRVGMPSLGIHECAVTSCKIWSTGERSDHAAVAPTAFSFVRFAVFRSTNAEGTTLKNLRVMDNRGAAVQATRVVDLTLGEPAEVEGGNGWTIRRAAGIQRQSSATSFGRCSMAVLELQFEKAVVAKSITWDMSENEPTLQWSLYGSADWRQWYPLASAAPEPEMEELTPKEKGGKGKKDKKNKKNGGKDGGGGAAAAAAAPAAAPAAAAAADAKGGNQNSNGPNKAKAELISVGPFPVIPWDDCTPTMAPHADDEFYHIPLILSTCAESVRIWSVCKDMGSSTHKGVCVGELWAGSASTDKSARIEEGWHEEAHTDEITCSAVMRGSRILTGSRDETIKVWHPATGQCEATLSAGSSVISCEAKCLHTSAHLGLERKALRSDEPIWHNQSCTIRHMTLLSESPGGAAFLSGAGQTPALVESGENEFGMLAWRLVPSENGLVHLQCDHDGKLWGLDVVAGGKVAMTKGQGCDWLLRFDEQAIVRSHKLNQGGGRGGRGGGGQAQGGNVQAWPLYSVGGDLTTATSQGVVATLKMWASANTDDTQEPPVELAAGDKLQFLGSHMRLNEQNWQEVVVVEGHAHGRTSGWIILDGAEESGHLLPLKKTSTVVQICTPDGEKILTAAESQQELFLEIKAAAGDNGFFRVEAAMPCEMVAAACENGSVHFWTQDSAYSAWVPNLDASKSVHHSGPISHLSIIPNEVADGASSMIAITCNDHVVDSTAPTDQQSIALWRFNESQQLTQRFDRKLHIRLWTPFMAHNICRLSPLAVEDYVAGMIKYVDSGVGDGYEITYADPTTTSLTANDMLRAKAQFEGLFFQLISRLRLQPAAPSVSRRSTNRMLEPRNAFLRLEHDDDHLYWITHARSETGYSLTFQADETLTLDDCRVGQVIRDASIPVDQLGGLYRVDAVVRTGEDMLGTGLEGTITVRGIDSNDSLADEVETGRDPTEFVRPGFWEGFQPPRDFPMLTYMLVPILPFNQTAAIVGLVWKLALCLPRLVISLVGMTTGKCSAIEKASLKKAVSFHTVAPNLDQQRELEWQELLESARDGSPVQACFVPVTNAAGPYTGSRINWSRLLGLGDAKDDPVELSLLHACVEYSSAHPEDQHELFALEVPEVLVQYKWMAYGRGHVCSKLRTYIWLVLLFSSFTVRTVDSGPFGQVGSNFDHGVVAGALCLTLWFCVNEVWSLAAQGWPQYLSDGWNLIDWSCYVLVIYCLLSEYKWEVGWDNPGSPQMALAQLMLWGKVLYFLRAFETTGVYILTMVHIMRDMKSFMFIFALIILGFGFAFYVLFNETDAFNGADAEYAYRNLGYAMLSTFNLGVLGDFSIDMFHDQEHEILLLALLVAIVIMITVVLLNMLIALMSSTYERATEHSAAASKYQRAQILLDIEATMAASDRSNPTYFPRYLHVLKEKQSALVPSADDDSAQHAQGAVAATQVDGLLAKVSKRQEEQAAEMARITQMLEKLCDSADGNEK